MERGPTVPPVLPGAVFLKKLIVLPFLASGVLRMGPGMPQDSLGFLFQAKPSILEPFRTKFDGLGT